MSLSIECPNCGSNKSEVKDSRGYKTNGVTHIRRRRSCIICEKRYSTLEFTEDDVEKAIFAVVEKTFKEIREAVGRVENSLKMGEIESPLSGIVGVGGDVTKLGEIWDERARKKREKENGA